METAQGTQTIRRRGRPAKIHGNPSEDFSPEEDEMNIEPIEGTGVADGDVLKLSPETITAVDQLRAFYRNNRGTEITRDQAIIFASGLALIYGRSITGTPDGKVTKVRL